MKKTTLLLCLVCVWYSATSQSLKPSEKIKEIKVQNLKFEPVNLLESTNLRDLEPLEDLKSFSLFTLNEKNVENLLKSSSEQIQISIPVRNQNMEINLELYEVNLGNFNLNVAPSGQNIKYQGGKYYRGIMANDPNSLVCINVFKNEISGFISSDQFHSNLVIGKLKNRNEIIIYEDGQLTTDGAFECGVTESINYTVEDLRTQLDNRALSDCVNLYLEVDFDIYQNKGGTTATTDYITGLFNQVATLYTNENINTAISEIVIWTETSPYNATTSSGMLNQFTAYRQGFNGDLAQLLSYQASGGIAYVNTLCNNNPDYRMSFASISSSYNTVPTYSWSVMVSTHELGHLMGSNHTHACSWNGNNTAIDGCYNTEGNCPQPPIPSQGGTIMSYCHLTSAGINFSLGFGPQPGDVIRNKVTTASCLQACAGDNGNGGDNGGDNGCNINTVTLNIILDNYPSETTWSITNSSNSVLYSGGPYSTQGGSVTQAFCLENGCYNFNIYDSWGDGICCAYGQGSYTLVHNGNILAEGGQFGSSQVTPFCVSDASDEATCDDGIQNGDETGIDCGGADCLPCATCDDGIQNGNETGIDCGGDCMPCDNPPMDDEEIFGHYFETGWDGWIDGGSDCSRYSGSNSYEGNYSIRLRDNSGVASSMTSPSFDASNFNQLNLEFYFIGVGMEPGEDFFVQLKDQNGWVTVADFVSTVDFQNGTFYLVQLTLGNWLQFYENNQLRITCDASTNSDHIYIDAVTLTGVYESSLVENIVQIIPLSQSPKQGEELEMAVYPNPCQDYFNISLTKYNEDEDDNSIYSVQLFDISGRLLYSKEMNDLDDDNIQTVNFDSGMYLLKILQNGETLGIQKLVISH